MKIEKFLKSKGLYYTRELINIADETINLPEIMKEYAKLYHESELKKLRVADVSVSVCDCTHTQACKICGSKKGLDGDFWDMIAKWTLTVYG